MKLRTSLHSLPCFSLARNCALHWTAELYNILTVNPEQSSIVASVVRVHTIHTDRHIHTHPFDIFWLSFKARHPTPLCTQCSRRPQNRACPRVPTYRENQNDMFAMMIYDVYIICTATSSKNSGLPFVWRLYMALKSLEREYFRSKLKKCSTYSNRTLEQNGAPPAWLAYHGGYFQLSPPISW